MNAATDISTPKSTKITDSPWFWVMLFSCVSLLAMQLVDWKYNQRQAQLERQFQGREWASQHGAQVRMNPSSPSAQQGPVPALAAPEQEPSDDGLAPESSGPLPTYSQPGQLVISLRPIKVLAMVALLVSSYLLWRKSHLPVSGSESTIP